MSFSFFPNMVPGSSAGSLPTMGGLGGSAGVWVNQHYLNWECWDTLERGGAQPGAPHSWWFYHPGGAGTSWAWGGVNREHPPRGSCHSGGAWGGIKSAGSTQPPAFATLGGSWEGMAPTGSTLHCVLPPQGVVGPPSPSGRQALPVLVAVPEAALGGSLGCGSSWDRGAKPNCAAEPLTFMRLKAPGP